MLCYFEQSKETPWNVALHSTAPTFSGGASPENSPGPSKVLRMFARSYTKVKFEN